MISTSSSALMRRRSLDGAFPWARCVSAPRYWFCSCANNAMVGGANVQRKIDLCDVTKQIICSPVVSVWDEAVCFLSSTAMIPNIEMTPLWLQTMSHLPLFSRPPVAAAWTCRETTTHVTPPASSGSTLSGQILLIYWNVSFSFFFILMPFQAWPLHFLTIKSNQRSSVLSCQPSPSACPQVEGTPSFAGTLQRKEVNCSCPPNRPQNAKSPGGSGSSEGSIR